MIFKHMTMFTVFFLVLLVSVNPSVAQDLKNQKVQTNLPGIQDVIINLTARYARGKMETEFDRKLADQLKQVASRADAKDMVEAYERHQKTKVNDKAYSMDVYRQALTQAMAQKRPGSPVQLAGPDEPAPLFETKKSKTFDESDKTNNPKPPIDWNGPKSNKIRAAKRLSSHGPATWSTIAAHSMASISAGLTGMVTAEAATYTLVYSGIYCREETDWDQFSWHDEYYIITTAVTDRGAVRTSKHPFRQRYYTGVDSGESRPRPSHRRNGRGADEICWRGPAEDLDLIVWVFEQDFGSPESVRRRFEAGANIVAAIYRVLFFVLGRPLDKDLIVDAVMWIGGVFDLEDDLIQRRRVSLSARQLRSLASRRYSIGRRSRLPRHFQTRHRGEGADIYAYFLVRYSR